MKGRLKSAIMALVVTNLTATVAVFALAFWAGSRSGGMAPWSLGAMHSDALYLLLGALAAAVVASVLLFFRLSKAVAVPKSMTSAGPP